MNTNDDFYEAVVARIRKAIASDPQILEELRRLKQVQLAKRQEERLAKSAAKAGLHAYNNPNAALNIFVYGFLEFILEEDASTEPPR